MHYGSEQPYVPASNHFSTSSGVNEQINERSGARKRSEQCGASEWMSSASEWANRGVSDPVPKFRFYFDFFLFWILVQWYLIILTWFLCNILYSAGSREYIDLHFTWEPNSKLFSAKTASRNGGGGGGGGGAKEAGDSILEEVATNGITYEDMLALIDLVLGESGYYEVKASH